MNDVETKLINEAIFAKMTEGLPDDPLLTYLAAIAAGDSEEEATRKEAKAQQAWIDYYEQQRKSPAARAATEFTLQRLKADLSQQLSPPVRVTNEELDNQ